MTVYFAVMAFIVALIVAVDMGLFRHWGFRLDSTIIPYLRTPKEAAASVTWGDLWPTILLLFGYGALLFFMWRPITKIYRYVKQTISQRITSTLVMLLVGGLLFLAIRGGVDTAPANVSKVYFSDNMFLPHARSSRIATTVTTPTRSVPRFFRSWPTTTQPRRSQSSKRSARMWYLLCLRVWDVPLPTSWWMARP